MGDRGPPFLTHTEQDIFTVEKQHLMSTMEMHDRTPNREKPSKYIVELNVNFTGRSNTCRRRHEHKLEITGIN